MVRPIGGSRRRRGMKALAEVVTAAAHPNHPQAVDLMGYFLGCAPALSLPAVHRRAQATDPQCAVSVRPWQRSLATRALHPSNPHRKSTTGSSRGRSRWGDVRRVGSFAQLSNSTDSDQARGCSGSAAAAATVPIRSDVLFSKHGRLERMVRRRSRPRQVPRSAITPVLVGISRVPAA